MASPRHTTFDALFAPLELGKKRASNRFVFASHQTNFATRHRFEKHHQTYYKARAAGGAGVIVLEGSVVHPSDWPYEYAVRGYEREVVDGYRLIADTVHHYDGLVLAHLTHSGMQGSSHYSQLPLWAPSPVPEVASREMPQEMDIEDIEAVVEGFGDSARLAMEGDLDGVEINAGQSSLIRQFMSPLTNQRADLYGGDLDHRLRFVRAVIGAVRKAVGPEAAVGLRLSVDEHAPWAGIKPEDAVEIAQLLVADGQLDFISCTTGSIFSTHLTRPGLYSQPGFAVPLVEAVKQAVPVPVFAQGSLVDPTMAAAIVASGQADAVEMTRALVADPELPKKMREGAADRAVPCLLCNQNCVVAQVQNPRLSCLVNPASGYEGRAEFAPLTLAPMRHRVMVVGAGPAGLEAARVAAERGHNVTVFERDEKVGGAIRLAAAAPERDRLARAIDWFETELRALHVPIETGVEVTPALVQDRAPEAVIVAVGGRPGHGLVAALDDTILVRTPRQVMRGEVPDPPGKAVVLDATGDQKSMGVAEWLADRGWRVEILTSDMFVGQRLTASQELTPWHQRAAAKGIGFHPIVEAETLADRRVMGVDVFGRTPVHIGDVDLVVDVVHEVPDEDLYFALKESGRRVFRVGDCVAPRAIGHAILEGFRAGREV